MKKSKKLSAKMRFVVVLCRVRRFHGDRFADASRQDERRAPARGRRRLRHATLAPLWPRLDGRRPRHADAAVAHPHTLSARAHREI
jgi:hypothetical protein